MTERERDEIKKTLDLPEYISKYLEDDDRPRFKAIIEKDMDLNYTFLRDLDEDEIAEFKTLEQKDVVELKEKALRHRIPLTIYWYVRKYYLVDLLGVDFFRGSPVEGYFVPSEKFKEEVCIATCLWFQLLFVSMNDYPKSPKPSECFRDRTAFTCFYFVLVTTIESSHEEFVALLPHTVEYILEALSRAKELSINPYTNWLRDNERLLLTLIAHAFATTRGQKTYVWWRAAYRALHDANIEVARDEDSFISFMHYNLKLWLDIAFALGLKDDKLTNPSFWINNMKNKSPFTTDTGYWGGKYTYYSHTPWNEWESKEDVDEELKNSRLGETQLKALTKIAKKLSEWIGWLTHE